MSALAAAIGGDDALPLAFVPAEYRVKWTTLPWEADQAHRLRRAVFCIEQGIFAGDDRDDIDAYAQQLVALSCVGGMPDQVVGTVRIHEEAPGVWFGSRLAPLEEGGRRLRFGGSIGQVAVTAVAEGGHYTLVTVETDQPGESEADRLAKRFLKLVHAAAEPGHLVRGAY